MGSFSFKKAVKKWRKQGVGEWEIRQRLLLFEKLLDLELEMKLKELFDGRKVQ